MNSQAQQPSPCPECGGVRVLVGYGHGEMFVGHKTSGLTSNPTQHGRTVETFLANPLGYDHLVFDVDDIAAPKTWLEPHGIPAGAIEDVTIPRRGAFQYLRFKDPEGNFWGSDSP